MKQIGTAHADFNLSGEIQVFSYALPAGPDGYALKGEVRLGDGAKDIAGGGTYSLRATLGGVTVFRSDMVVLAGVVRRIFDFECWGRPGETLLVFATGLAADVDVDVTTYLYTGVNVVEISEDEAAADALETVLDGTGGAVLKAAQLKLSCNVDDEGALDCRNSHDLGLGQANIGGYVGQQNRGTHVGGSGQYNEGASLGQKNVGGSFGQYNEGDNIGQSNYSPAVGQKNSGGMAGIGQENFGVEAVKNQGFGATPKALTLIGAADRIDDILTDTADMQPRFVGITVLANWLRGLFRKLTMDATAKGEVNTGGGTFNEATDSEEALGEKTAAIKAKTDTIGAADLMAVSPILADGDLEIVQGDDYMDADGRALEWGETNYTGPIQDGDDAEFALMETADYHAAGGTTALTKAGTAHLVGTTLRIVVELTAAETAALEPSPPDDRMNYTYQVRVDVGSSGSGERQVTAALGSATVKKKVVA